MNKKLLFSFLLIIIFASLFTAFGFQDKNDPKAEQIITKMESITNIENTDVTATILFLQQKTGEPDKIYKARYYRRDKDNAFVIIFLEPDSEKGKGYLRLEDNLYMYMPSTREFIHKNRKENVGSTDAKAEDFEKKKTLDLYYVKMLPNAVVNKSDCYVIELTAKQADVSYPIQRWYIRVSDYLTMKQEAFSLSGTLMQVSYYIKYIPIKGGKMFLTKFMTENKIESSRTWVTVDEASLSFEPIPDYVFTKAFLEQQSKQ
ncbi:MAG TPA: outer membrane lipoprotein-sorting protein [Exilispira sp.]|nr:outer membrane lipoprotein-sorting protein [Exilispira sp.]